MCHAANACCTQHALVLLSATRVGAAVCTPCNHVGGMSWSTVPYCAQVGCVGFSRFRKGEQAVQNKDGAGPKATSSATASLSHRIVSACQRAHAIILMIAHHLQKKVFAKRSPVFGCSEVVLGHINKPTWHSRKEITEIRNRNDTKHDTSLQTGHIGRPENQEFLLGLLMYLDELPKTP